MASAVCVLVGTEGVSGTVTFTAEGGATKVSGEITGLVRSPLRSIGGSGWRFLFY